jgi:metallo-beta-lactamase family protein
MDSPMAISATDIMIRHHPLHRLNSKQCAAMCEHVQFTNDVEQSKAIGLVNAPKIILSASGMATGGRVLHHLKTLVGDSHNSILFAGYQATGTLGDRLVSGEKSVKIHGQFYPVQAEIHQLDFLSAHADHQQVINWLSAIDVAPKKTFVVHGEEAAAAGLSTQITRQLGWPVHIPRHGEKVQL